MRSQEEMNMKGCNRREMLAVSLAGAAVVALPIIQPNGEPEIWLRVTDIGLSTARYWVNGIECSRDVFYQELHSDKRDDCQFRYQFTPCYPSRYVS
jgi:hypothetical protein